MGIFDDILARAPEEDRTILSKYPELRNSIDKLETDLGAVSRYAGQWVNWQQENWDPDAGMTKREKQLSDDLAAAQARMAAGIPGAAEDVAALRKDFEAKLEDQRKQQLAAVEGMNLFYQSTQRHMLPHFNEFKENLDPQALMSYMQSNKISDPDIAYDRMVAQRRAEISAQAAKDLEAKHAADLEAARQEGYQKHAQEQAMGPGGVMPTDSTGGIAGVTARIDKPATISEEAKAKIGEAKLGDGSLAQIGLEMYRRGELPVQ